jgi:tetratricopeptide (TPR) repeat protein
VHVAHRLADGFPDGQVFLPLHGHTPGQQPVDPVDALASLLQASGIPVQCLPEGLEPRVLLWRDRLAGRRMLLVLDNAASSGQVVPLLPGEGGCLVLVTSRRHLGDLPGAVMPVALDVLKPVQAADMFTGLAPRAAGSQGEVAEVVRLAGFLPLAICLLARLFVRHPSWTLADLSAETKASLLTLTAEHDSVAAAFEVSFRHLAPDRQRFFCLLGLHPGASIDAYAAAALARTSLNEAAGLLDTLHGEGLLTETRHRRYGMHDLLRRYARDHAADLPGGEQAVQRLLDYYEHTAVRADALIDFHSQPGPLPAAPAGLPAAPDLDDGNQALAWARAERASLLACHDYATCRGQHARVITLTAGVAGLLRRDGPFADAVTRCTAAVRAAAHLGDRLGEANALTHLGSVRWRMSEYSGAVQAAGQALEIYRDLGDRLGEGNALVPLGSVLRRTGDYPGAARLLEQSLRICRDTGGRPGEIAVLNELGILYTVMGDFTQAEECHQEALEPARAMFSPWDEAHALAGLGRCAMNNGHVAQAEDLLRQALEIFQRIGAAEARDLLTEVNTLTGP